MELSVRDWMIIVGIVLIVVVLADGFRRVRNERRGKIRMSLNRNFLNAQEGEGHSSELPNGGARVIDARDPESEPYAGTEPNIGDENLQLDQLVPMLMESVEERSAGDEHPAPPQPDADITVSQDQYNRAGDGQGSRAEAAESDLQRTAVNQPEQVTQSTQPPAAAASDPAQQEVFVINVAAKDGAFKGPDLLHILLACDLRFGEMSIFHRHEQANGSGAVQFSMANSVAPGVFDLDAINEFSTPSVSFFMSVPGAENSMQSFDAMVETAQCLVKNMGGEMRDESRSVMTLQTLEHCRQKIRDIERRQLTRSV
ncbi:MAG: cell division protein ZipA [Paraglaciecola psychrophila]|jgi:cell division protein ZipA